MAEKKTNAFVKKQGLRFQKKWRRGGGGTHDVSYKGKEL